MRTVRPLIVISPHLDDAVFGCGALIAANPDARVVTVFAGAPDVEMPAPDWDRSAGFITGAQAVLARRREDSRALGVLKAHPIWLDFWDSQYGRTYEPMDIATNLRRLLQLDEDGLVLAPLGLFHSDHVLVHEACRLLMHALREETRRARRPALLQPPRRPGDQAPGVQESEVKAATRTWLWYEDAIYRRYPAYLQRRLCGLLEAGYIATPVLASTREHLARKSEAVNAYSSQLQLFNEDQLGDLCAPERYWSLVPADEAEGVH